MSADVARFCVLLALGPVLELVVPQSLNILESLVALITIEGSVHLMHHHVLAQVLGMVQLVADRASEKT